MTQMDREIHHVHESKNQYSENEYTSQNNLQSQCNPYQATNGIFQRTRTNNFTICMEIQKTSNSQSNVEKKNGIGGINLPDFRLQSLKQYGIGTKTEIQINGRKQKAQR